MADNATAPAQASAPTSGANGRSTSEDHLGNIVQGFSSAFALVGLGFKQIRSYFTPAPQPVPSRRVSTICKHMFDLVPYCKETKDEKCKQHYAPLLKYCTILGTTEKVKDSKATDQTTPEEDAKMPIPFRALLLSYRGCMDARWWNSEMANDCLEKYNKLLETIVYDNDQDK